MKLNAFLIHAVGIALAATAPAQAAQKDTVAELISKAGNSKLIFVGEMHGTREVPALVADLAQRLAEPGAPGLVVALEYPQTDAAQLKAYFDGDGSAVAKKQLLDSPFWSRAAQDGRSSHAMLALIESVRMQARSGRKIQLAAFDMNASQEKSGVSRDQSMAENLRAIIEANPSARVIALTGNYHARQADGAPWNPKHRFMAGYMKDLKPYSINVEALRGSYWACSSGKAADCMVITYGVDPALKRSVGLYADQALTSIGYAQGLTLEQFSVSLPAVRAQ
ncbi:MAG: calcium-binding protein [Pseudomonadota bacterium]